MPETKMSVKELEAKGYEKRIIGADLVFTDALNQVVHSINVPALAQSHEALLKGAYKYGSHLGGCDLVNLDANGDPSFGKCTCGFAELLAEAEKVSQ